MRKSLLILLLFFLFVVCCANPTNENESASSDSTSIESSSKIFSCDESHSSQVLKSSSSHVSVPSSSKAFDREASYLGDKGFELMNVKSDNGFVFFTDTHEKANDQNTAKIINFALDNTPIDKVVWGGDAISAYGSKDDLDKQWSKQKEIFQSLKKGTKILCTRGNHDFTIRTSSSNSSGYTYSQIESFKMMNEVIAKNVVRNMEDSSSLYYYFDDDLNKIRFIVVEAYSNSAEGNVAWKVAGGIKKIQLDWIVNSAILTTPSGYGIIFVLHAPITDTTGGVWKSFDNISKVVAAAAEKQVCVLKESTYDFSSLDDVNILMVVSGHHHHDMQTFQHGVLHVTTASDAHYKDFTRDPFAVETSRGKGYLQHAVDVFSIDLEQRIVQTIRIGVGGNRKFHLDPIEINVGDCVSVSISLDSFVKWYSYNASGNNYKDGKWTLNNDVISVSENGCVTGESIGEAVLMAQDKLGNREIFNVKVH